MFQSTQAEVYQTGYQGQPDTQSTDWDVTSVERFQSTHTRDNKSVSSSLHNFLDSASVETQSVLSQNNEHLGNPDHNYGTRNKPLDEVDEKGEGLTQSSGRGHEGNSNSAENLENSDSDENQDNLIDFRNTGAENTEEHQDNVI